MASKTRTLEQRQAELQAKLNKLQARKRAASTREKIVVGAAITSEAISDATFAKSLCKILGQRVKREHDQAAITDLLKRLGCQSEQSDFAEAPITDEGGEGHAYTSPSATCSEGEKPVGGEAPPPPFAGEPENSGPSRLARLNLLRR
ncbi:MAG: hypothetical protein HQL43_02570 [Alphaproteobacteria bacterium]|nr:hypothetical protein [Alphaproteobacteria bacterium]